MTLRISKIFCFSASAISELEQVTLQNSSAAESSAAAAEELRAQAEGLNKVVQDINVIIHGQSEKSLVKPSSASATAKVINLPVAKKPENKSFSTEFKKTGSGDFIPSADDDGFKE